MFTNNGIETKIACNSHMTLLSFPVKNEEKEVEDFFVCERKNSVAILVKEKELLDNERFLLVWQHRFASNKFGWEIPQGSIEEGEKDEESAVRELFEETGFKVKQIDYFGSIYEAADWCTSKTLIFTSVVESVRVSDYELKCEWFTVDEIKRMFFNGLIFDAVTLAALLLYNSRGEITHGNSDNN